LFTLIKLLHNRLVFGRRVRVLSDSFAKLIPPGSSVLDIGCGSGQIAFQTMQSNPSLFIRGIEPAPRPRCLIECGAYDGSAIPYADGSFDCCMFVDVLHHTNDMAALLKEASRVSRRYILIKDHLCETQLDRALLSLMDWVGNRPHGVKLTYNYIDRRAWEGLFSALHLHTREWTTDIPLYAFPLNMVFSRRLHFIAQLEKK
jgi:SAM-dependent methyltransferase